MIRSGVDKLLEFGTHKHSLVGNIKNIFSAFSVVLIWTILITLVLKTMMGVGTNEIRSILVAKMSFLGAVLPASISKGAIMGFFLACVFAPLWEELAFRYVPLEMAKSLEVMLVRGFSHKVRRDRGVEFDHEHGHLYGNLKGTGFILPTILLSSVIFGQAHGSTINIMVQGVGGIVFSWLMIKGGYWSSVIAHSMWNFMLMIGMPIILK
ncbi:MAG: CPBP family intramembrane glutamic endopeptidase [Minisyncoccota bacterium]